MTNQPMTEQDIIREAEAISELTLAEMYSSTKFADELSAALWTLTLDSYQDDEYANEADGSWFARIDRWILLCDSGGYVNHRSYKDDWYAKHAFSELIRDIENVH
jgi:hypothetical protein